MSDPENGPHVHRRGDEYVVILPQMWMNETGYGTHHYADPRERLTHAGAKSVGLRRFGHDDFNIGQIRDGRLVAILWMDEDLGEEPALLDAIALEIGLTPATVPG